MKRIIFVFVFLVLFFVPTRVYAICVDSELARLKNLSKQIEIFYELDEDKTYTITMTNLVLDVEVWQSPLHDVGVNYNYFDKGTASFDNYPNGESYTFIFRGGSMTPCADYLLETREVALPYINPYYDQSICNGAESYFLCKKFADTRKYTTAEIFSLINEYKTNDKDADDVSVGDNIEKLDLWELIVDNMWYISMVIAGISIIALVVIYISEKRRSLL